LGVEPKNRRLEEIDSGVPVSPTAAGRNIVDCPADRAKS
jgi:hypothetical protein